MTRSVEEFCQRHGICRATFYKILKDGKGPRIMKVGGQTRISDAAESDWIREREQAAAEAV